MTCALSELPVDQCACRVHKPTETVETNAFEIVARYAARFDSRLACGHSAVEGDSIARTVDGDHVCEECAS